MKILVALDATPECSEIVAEIASRPWSASTSFLLLHVLEPFSFKRMPRSFEHARDAAEERLEEMRRRLCVSGWATEHRVVVGRPRQQITKLAASLKSDLIVIGSHGARALSGALLGSTARAVIRRAPCSVEIVRPNGDRNGQVRSTGKNVLIATDGSDCSTIALRSVAGWTWPEGSRFRVISIPHPSMPISSFRESELKDVIEFRHAKRDAEVGAEILRSAGLKAESDIQFPYHKDGCEIVKEAERWHAQLIVLGSHGRHGFDRLTIGSVSEYVALHASCSVAVIRGVVQSKGRSGRISRKE